MSFFNFDELINETTEESLNEAKEIEILSKEEKAKQKFRKYAGLDNNIKIIPSDIKTNWNNAYMRVCREDGYPKEGLIDILLEK